MPRQSSPVSTELSWAQVHAFRLAGHHLSKRAPKQDLAKAVGDIGGAQAQVMSAAELQVGVRVDCKVEDVRTALWKDRTLVKTWLMRGTLHLVPSADLPLYTAAMGTRWIQVRNSWLKFVELSEPEFKNLLEAIGDAMGERPMTREELIAVVGKGRSEHIRSVLGSGWGGLLKPVARSGLLCFGPSRGQSVTFVRPQQWLGSWRDHDPDVALVEVARRYLRAFGPATRGDFARWWGAWPGVGNAAWAGLAEELVPVTIEGQRADMLRSDMRRLAAPSDGPAVQLLPAFDPYLMGYKNRDHLFEAEYRWRVSRTAGWISPVVLVDGRVVATWTYQIAKQALRVTVEPLRKFPPKALSGLRAGAAAISATLGLAESTVKVASG